MNKRNPIFQKAAHEALKQTKQKEQISRHEIDASWKTVEKNLSGFPEAVKRKPLRRHFLIAGSFAASVLLLVSIHVWQVHSTSDTSPSLHHKIVPEGKNEYILLSDGSKIHIKANSHIIYPNVFPENKREITLIKGEIYLEVARNPQAPFTVLTDDFQVKVLGTTFDVSVAEKGNPATVILVEGSVEIENIRKEKALLCPNQLADISPEGIEIKEVNVSKYICWKDQIVLLEEEPLGKILEQLSAYYAVPIECDKEIIGFPLSGKLDLNDSAEKTLRIIQLSTGFNCQKIKNGFYLHKE